MQRKEQQSGQSEVWCKKRDHDQYKILEGRDSDLDKDTKAALKRMIARDMTSKETVQGKEAGSRMQLISACYRAAQQRRPRNPTEAVLECMVAFTTPRNRQAEPLVKAR